MLSNQCRELYHMVNIVSCWWYETATNVCKNGEESQQLIKTNRSKAVDIWLVRH